MHEKDLIFINELDSFETNLFDNLEVRKRAIGNWKRLRVLLVMMKLSGGKVRGSEKSPDDFKIDKVKTTCREWFANIVIHPMSRTRIAFEMFMGYIYFTCYLLDPYIISLRFKPL